ncbi:MAG: PQQ-binding-like beta-propeller repeat protein [Methanomicrobiaceae archaeon]|nr:PQQ-binding-like beta-propeller repeat protein [Methanomicrobiaceae archaeon]
MRTTLRQILVICMAAMLLLPFTAGAQENYTEPTANDWPMVNYDAVMSRNSPQTDISKDNVGQLQVKWIFNTEYTIENSPLIVNDTAYIENNAMQIFALDIKTGLPRWQYDVNVTKVGLELPRVSTSHGMTYQDGVLYAPTGPNGTVIALDAETGSRIWESPIMMNGTAWRISAPPLIWKDYVIAGSALGDDPPFGFPAKGAITALNRTDGSIIWQTPTAVGAWVEGENATTNGGATTWSGGAIDEEKGILYVPCGNPAPDFTAEPRPEPTKYANYLIAIEIATGKILWGTPFIAEGTVLPNVTIPDTHDWDTAWGSHLVTVDTPNGTQQLVIAHDKRGDLMAMNASTGKPVWWNNLAVTYNVDKQAAPSGSDVVWPGPGHGLEAYTAVDNDTLYADVSNMGMRYFTDGHVEPAFDAIANGIGNGSVTAVDLATGEIKWRHETAFPTWTSPLVTNGLVFAGHITATGKPYPYNAFGGPTSSPVTPSGILLALDKDTGDVLWQANVGAQVCIGGPSIGQGMLLVPTGGIQTPNSGGSVVAFGLPENVTTDFTKLSEEAAARMTPVPAQTPAPPATLATPAMTPAAGANQTATPTPAANQTTGAAGNQTPAMTTAATNVTTAATTGAAASATAGATGAAGGGTTTIDLTAENIAFDQSTITVPAGANVTVNFNNKDSGIPHNFAVYTDSSAAEKIFVGEIITGPATTTYTFTAPSTPGTYFFRCDDHPQQMTGDLVVQ